MRIFPKVPIFIPLIAVCCFAQNPGQDSPVTILESSWQHARVAPKKIDNQEVTPARMLTADDKNFRRTAREQQSKGSIDPAENTIDGRRAALDKIVQESRTPKTGDIDGYAYLAKVRNNGGRKIDVVFWEYRFTELANPSNVVRRQFLCAANMKPGETKDLSLFSLLGPSEVISAESLSKTTDKLFDEKVIVNRIEFSDGSSIQRRDWKYDDFQKAIERITSTPWGKETCRGI
jgi:hypothetical protein